MSSNLPPGCTSPDGGIDHAFEAASESLLDLCETADDVMALVAVAPAVLALRRDAFREGVEDQILSNQERADRGREE